MKKTFSLKLMLLGLFALVSTGVWAQYTAVDGVVYGLSPDNKSAIVKGVLAAKNLPDGTLGGAKAIKIADEVTIKGKAYKVTGFDAKWKEANGKDKGGFRNDSQSSSTSATAPTNPGLNDGSDYETIGGGTSTAIGTVVYYTVEAATVAGKDADEKVKPLDFILNATKLEVITKDDIDGLPIAAFVLGENSGVTEIPENLFAVCDTPVEGEKHYTWWNGATSLADAEAKLTAAKNQAKANLDGTYDIYNGKRNGKQVYKLLTNQYGGDIADAGFFVVVGEQVGTDEAKNLPLYELLQLNDANGFLKNPTAISGMKVRASADPEEGMKKLVDPDHDVYAAEILPADFKYPENGTAGLYNQLEDALAAQAAADQAVVDGEAALTRAKAKELDPDNYADSKLKKAALRLAAAIEPFDNAALGAKVAALYTNVNNPTKWYIAFICATIDDLTKVVEKQSELEGWKEKVKEFKEAYEDFYGTGIDTLLDQETASGWEFTSWGASGDIHHNNSTVTATNYVKYGNGVFQVMGTEGDFTVLKVVTNEKEPKEVGKTYYVKAAEANFGAENTYFVLYKKNEETGKIEIYGTPASAGRMFAPQGVEDNDAVVGNVSDGTNSASVKAVYLGSATYNSSEYDVYSNFQYTGEGETPQFLSGLIIPNGDIYVDGEGNVYNYDGDYIDPINVSFKDIQKAPDTPSTVVDDEVTYSSVVVITFGDKKDVTISTTIPEEIPLDAADVEKDIQDAIDAVQTSAQADAALNDPETGLKKKAQDAAAEVGRIRGLIADNENPKGTTVNGVEKLLSEFQSPADLQKMTQDPTTYTLNLDGKNETLVLGAFRNNKLEEVGAHAFYNCVKAKFEGTFPATIKKIEAGAFQNTLFEDLDLSETGKADWRGDKDENKVLDTDEDGNLVPDGKVDILDRLTGSNTIRPFGEDFTIGTDIEASAFYGTPLKSMHLETTNLGDGWVKDVVSHITFKTVEYTYDCDVKLDRLVNQTLTTVTLPDNEGEEEDLEFDRIQAGTFQDCVELPTITIPAQVYQIEQNAFNGCDKLATITFAAEDSELERIGISAFYGTAATEIDLTAQTNLGINPGQAWNNSTTGTPVGIGNSAFAEMTNLQTVNFTNTKLTSLPDDLFAGDVNLATVTFYNAADPKSGSFMATLPAGLFRDNKIAVLDIAKTRVTVLENLFQAGNGSEKAKDCHGNEIVLDPFNTTLTAVKLPAWLKSIETNALAHMHNPAFKTVEVPGSVEELGEGVFGDDKYLETVSFFNYENDPAKKDFLDGSMLTQLPAKTFAQCPNLKNVYFVTYETLDNDVFGDNCFFSAGTNNPGEDARTKVYVNHDSFDALKSTVVYSSTYSKLMAFETSLKGKEIHGLYYKPWTSNYGTWIEAVDEGENAVGVYTAYQDGHKIILYPAKKSTFEGKQYYKIAAYNDDQAKAALGFPAFQPTSPIENEPILPSYNGFYYVNEDGLEVFVPFPAIGETFSTTGAAAATIPTEIAQLLEARVSFGSMGVWGDDFNPSTDVLAKTWMAFGTAIIISSKQEVPYIQKTNPDQKYQSTLDLANQLSVTSTDIPRDDDNNWYYLAKADGKAKFIHQDTDSKIKFIPKGSVAFLQTSKQGQGAREFDIDIVSENEATAIGGVMEYISAKNSDAIYNLQGVRVSATQKGQMYIQGGKKFIQK